MVAGFFCSFVFLGLSNFDNNDKKFCFPPAAVGGLGLSSIFGGIIFFISIFFGSSFLGSIFFGSGFLGSGFFGSSFLGSDFFCGSIFLYKGKLLILAFIFLISLL